MHACFDAAGRLLVADSLGINPTGELLTSRPAQVIRLLEDTDADGRFDKSTIVADKLAFPEGVLWHNEAIFTASPPSLWRLEIAGSDGAVGERRELVTGWVGTGIADDLHGPALGPDGRIYWSCGRFKHEIHRHGEPIVAAGRAPVLMRCRPDGSDFEILCGAQGNPVKAAFTDEGEMFLSGTWSKKERARDDVVLHCLEGANYPQLDGDFFSPEFKHTPDLLPPLISFGPASAAGIVRYRSMNWGAEFRDNLFVALFNMRQVTRHVLERDGATFRASTEQFLISTDNDFRPSDVIEDADGSLLVINCGTWSNACGAFRGGGQAKAPGSIYRIRKQGVESPRDARGLRIAWNDLSTVELIAQLDDPRFAVRDHAIEKLVDQGGIAAVELAKLLQSESSVAAKRQAIWALARIGSVPAQSAILAALADKVASIRLTACIAIGLDRDVAALPKLVPMLDDEDRAVRREAATALGRLGHADGAAPLLEAVRNRRSVSRSCADVRADSNR